KSSLEAVVCGFRYLRSYWHSLAMRSKDSACAVETLLSQTNSKTSPVSPLRSRQAITFSDPSRISTRKWRASSSRNVFSSRSADSASISASSPSSSAS
ncbi:hypothetical protein BN1708_016982, partial [Verticillium longisporum]